MLLISLSYCHLRILIVLVTLAAKIDIGFREFGSESLHIVAIFLTKKSTFLRLESRPGLRGVIYFLAKVNGIRRLFHSLSCHHLISGRMIVILLSLSCARLTTSMRIFDRKISFLQSISCKMIIFSACDERFSWRSLIRYRRAGLGRSFVSTQGKVTGAQVFRLCGNLQSNLIETIIALQWVIVSVFVTTLLQSRQRLVVSLHSFTIANLNLMQVGSTFHVHSVLSSTLSRQLVRLIGPLVSFKLVALLEAHFEVMLALGCHLQVTRFLAKDILCGLLHTSFVLGQIV